jgi:penicillin-binding protein 1C
VAWKTGTSWGGRDAWAMGFDAAHVAGVWVGRPDGTPLPGATGRNLALPLLSRVMGLLPPAPRPERRSERAVGATPARERTGQEEALRLLFPPPGAVMGGRRPLTFLVDGDRLPADPARREAAWLPQGPGFYRLTVLDAEGSVARATVRVR